MSKDGKVDQCSTVEEMLSYEDTVIHLKAGYDNLQSMVRFMDTKASAVVGFTVTLSGVIFALVKHVSESLEYYRSTIDGWTGAWEVVPYSLWLLFVCFLLSSGWIVYRAFLCLVPRTPNSSATVLFPYIEYRDKSGELLKKSKRDLYGDQCISRLNLFASGSPEKRDVLVDYKEQSISMGQIMKQKIIFCEKSVWWLKWNILVAISIVIPSFLIYFPNFFL